MLLNPFTYKHLDGNTYTVEAEVSVIAPLSFNRHTAACKDDLEEELIVDDVVVYNAEGKEVELNFDIPEHVFFREIGLQEAHYEEVDYEPLSEYDFLAEGERFYGR